MGLFDDVPIASRPRRAMPIDRQSNAPDLPVGGPKPRARIADPGALFDAPTALTNEEAHLWDLRPGCRGRAEIRKAEAWNNPNPPPELNLRIELWRDWGFNNGPLEPYVCFLGLNPAMADATRDDHTSNCYIEFAERLGYKSYCAINLSPIISTDPAALENPAYAYWLVSGAAQSITSARLAYAKKAVFCFGSLTGRPKRLREEAERLARVMQLEDIKMYCYGVTADGAPRHLSRLAYDTPLQIWKGW